MAAQIYCSSNVKVIRETFSGMEGSDGNTFFLALI